MNRLALEARVLDQLEFRHDGADKACGDPVLQIEGASGSGIETIGPEQSGRSGIDQLHANAEVGPFPSQGSAQNVIRSLVEDDLLRIDVPASMRQVRNARDNRQLAKTRQCSADVVDESVEKPILSRIAGEVGEGK